MISDTSELKHTREEVLTKVRQIFPGEDYATIVALLDAALEASLSGGERVQLAILKLSKGNVDKLLHYIEAATEDWRDVLYWAEYPNSAKVEFGRQQLQDASTAQIYREQDREQYLAWLYEANGEPDPPSPLLPKAEHPAVLYNE